MDELFTYLQSTMLVERMIGVFVYAVTLLYFCHKISRARTPDMVDRYLKQYLIVLCVMAFFYIPGTTADLYRWRLLAEPWKERSFKWFLSNRMWGNATPLGYLFIYLCQMTGIDGLLPMLSCYVYFVNIFHIFKCEARRKDASPDTLYVTLFCFMSAGSFLEAISGVRCLPMFALVIRALYDEVYRKKSMLKNVPIYVVAALVHNAVIPLIGLRIACSVLEKKRNIWRTAFDILIALSMFALSVVLGRSYLEAAFKKAQSYVSGETYSYIWEYIIAFLGLLLIVYVLRKYRKRYPRHFREDVNLVRILVPIIVMMLVLFRVYAIFHRYFLACAILVIPIIAKFLNCERKFGFRFSRQVILIVSTFILILACTRGELCGYKFFLMS